MRQVLIPNNRSNIRRWRSQRAHPECCSGATRGFNSGRPDKQREKTAHMLCALRWKPPLLLFCGGVHNDRPAATNNLQLLAAVVEPPPCVGLESPTALRASLNKRRGAAAYAPAGSACWSACTASPQPARRWTRTLWKWKFGNVRAQTCTFFGRRLPMETPTRAHQSQLLLSCSDACVKACSTGATSQMLTNVQIGVFRCLSCWLRW